MSSKILVKEFSLWANIFLPTVIYKCLNPLNIPQKAWHIKWKLKFHWWVWLQMLNCCCLGSLLRLGPPIPYIPYTEANNAFGEICALFLSLPDGKELRQVWVRGICWLRGGLLWMKTIGTDKGWDSGPLENWGGSWAQGGAIGELKLSSPVWQMWALRVCLRSSS